MGGLGDIFKQLSKVEEGSTLLRGLIQWLRPDDVNEVKSVENKIALFIKAIEANPEEAATIRDILIPYTENLRFLSLYSKTGILPRRSFVSEMNRRIYDKLMPKPPVIYGASNLIESMFSKQNDHIWVEAVPAEKWLTLYQTLIPNKPRVRINQHLRGEMIYALEILSIWLASEEINDELLRLDPSTLDRESNLIAQERELDLLIAKFREQPNEDSEQEKIDVSHAWVMLEQCSEQIRIFHQLSLNKGSDLKLTYLLERLEQILTRVRKLLSILEADEQDEKRAAMMSVALFKELVREQGKENSVVNLVRQTSYMLAKSVTNHASRAGEHYVTHNRKEYARMFGCGVGAGIFIALMAYIKIFILSLNLTLESTTFWVSLNYGLGFVIIYMCRFTVATKQPAMTAAYIAKQLEYANNGSVNQKNLAQLIIKVCRSQFAAILGNVLGALPAAISIASLLNHFLIGQQINADTATELMEEQNPITSLALFYAAVAGFWLFVSGIVSGYFDNRSLYLDLPGRIRLHPIARALFRKRVRDCIANYIDNHYGALWGNFFFGIMLGVTSYIGYIFAIPLDVRHVAFSVSNVGYSAATVWPGAWVFLEFVLFALLIGVVNLTVSFVLALNVAIRSRGLELGDFGSIFRAYWKEVLNRPQDIVIPPKNE